MFVDRGAFVLVVFRDGHPLREFPVGLGREGATPSGLFHIANKISNPDWYDGNRVVKGGDPANPLGRRWMGLGVGAVPTSYGIHATPQAQSIGRAMSRGCIRMRPGDAETLFRLCPVGTPVCIGESGTEAEGQPGDGGALETPQPSAYPPGLPQRG